MKTQTTLCLQCRFYLGIKFQLLASFILLNFINANGQPAATPPCTATDEILNYCDVIPTCPNETSITESGYWITIKTNGIPNHAYGIFPISFCGRPTALKEQDHIYVIPQYPDHGSEETMLTEVKDIPVLTPFGIAINGIVFDPAAAEWWNNDKRWQKNALVNADMANDLDCNNAHVQPDGSYHYHGFPRNLYDTLGGTFVWEIPAPVRPVFSKTVMLGWGFDGTPVYGPVCYKEPTDKIKIDYWIPEPSWAVLTTPRGPGNPTIADYPRGSFEQDYVFTSGSGDLDECNGHFAPTPEFPDGIYHYHITIEYPYIPRCYHQMIKIEGPTDIDLD